MPTRDVDVTYELAVGGKAATERMRWSAASELLRVDPPSPGIYMIADYGRHNVAIVSEARRSVTISPAPAAAIPGTPGFAPGGGFERGDQDQVAGMSCTEWSAVDTEDRHVRICLTDDGVLLRLRAQGHTVLLAKTVTYGSQDAAAFTVPAEYRRVSLFGD